MTIFLALLGLSIVIVSLVRPYRGFMTMAWIALGLVIMVGAALLWLLFILRS